MATPTDRPIALVNLFMGVLSGGLIAGTGWWPESIASSIDCNSATVHIDVAWLCKISVAMNGLSRKNKLAGAVQ